MLSHPRANHADQKQKPQWIDVCHDLSVWNKWLKPHLLSENVPPSGAQSIQERKKRTALFYCHKICSTLKDRVRDSQTPLTNSNSAKKKKKIREKTDALAGFPHIRTRVRVARNARARNLLGKTVANWCVNSFDSRIQTWQKWAEEGR